MHNYKYDIKNVLVQNKKIYCNKRNAQTDHILLLERKKYIIEVLYYYKFYQIKKFINDFHQNIKFLMFLHVCSIKI